MEVNNPLYKNQGIHLISTIFTVEDGITKVLLIKRKNNPYKDYWALVGGALYNNEDLIDGLKRELKEKTGIENIKFLHAHPGREGGRGRQHLRPRSLQRDRSDER